MPPIERLEWDSAFFGVPIGRLSMSRASAKQVAEVVHRSDGAGLECLYWLVDGQDATSLTAAETCGFHLVDIQMTFEVSLPSRAGSGRTDRRPVRPLQPGDLPALLALAAESHRDSRFFHDGHFPEAKCAEMYREWIRKAQRDPSDAVLVAELNDKPSGYCVCHRTVDEIGSIGLLAVAPDCQRHHLGTALVFSGLDHFTNEGLRIATVVTQGRNVASQRLYQSCGFVTKSVKLWFHRWAQRSKHQHDL